MLKRLLAVLRRWLSLPPEHLGDADRYQSGMLIGIRPSDQAYENNVGAIYHPQDENDGGNVPFYEITSTDDEIQFDLAGTISGLDNPVMVLNTVFGPTDFDLIDVGSGQPVVSEQSGFDSDVWYCEIGDTTERFVLTNFDTADGVDGTQAAWYPFVTVYPLKA